MSDMQVFTRTFDVEGGTVDADLRAVLRDSLGRTAYTATLENGIEFDDESGSYSLSLDTAWICEGAIEVAWYAKLDGTPIEPYPYVEVRGRTPRAAQYLGATADDLLERMRGITATDFAPIQGEGEGAQVLGRFLGGAAAVVAAALPPVLDSLLTAHSIVLCDSCSGGTRHFALNIPGGRIVSTSIYTGDSILPMAPTEYMLDGDKIVFARTPRKGMRIWARVRYSGFAPQLLRKLTADLASLDAASSLAPSENGIAERLDGGRKRVMESLDRLRRGELVPDELRRCDELKNALLPGAISTGRLRAKR